ncbi:MAG TPA: FG-GAP-like repeat-containing protein [Acidobacteriota bacterium]|nr:FG-GAP-like repeat-containing protein [Acidobacteriota bacterium]
MRDEEASQQRIERRSQKGIGARIETRSRYLSGLKNLLPGLVLLCLTAFAVTPHQPVSFEDVTTLALGHNPSFGQQLSYGIDYWTQYLDVSSRIDFFALNGLAIGDYDGDGFDDFYVCQPGGLPNRLFRNQGDATFLDVTTESDLNVLDSTSAALWADYDNDGRQDLFLLTDSGILLFENKGGRKKFQLSQRARFEIPPEQQGVVTGGAIADYDRDGLLDLYICQYSRATGTMMANSLLHPTPYHDAQNGAPNQLFRNNGDGSFSNVTDQTGLSANNDGWSFAAAWGDYNGDRFPDLYVANDFGPNNLYLNGGDGTFEEVADAAGVKDPAAGMSATWGDFNNDGKPDLYVGNIWSKTGQTIMAEDRFQPEAPESVRRTFQRFAAGNALFLNRSDGTFEQVDRATGAAAGGWAWSSDFIDVDNDGWEDFYVVNGQVTNDRSDDLETFHWEELVGHSPLGPQRSVAYANAWRKFQRLMLEEGYSIHGSEQNRLFLNHQGRYYDASAGSGLDYPDDGRAFGISDFDVDGDLDVIVKNRTAPQIRVLRNGNSTDNTSVAFELVGTNSNRDAVGTRILLRSGDQRRHKEVKAGSGFLSQHSHRVYFGLPAGSHVDEVRIEWISGITESFKELPVGSIIRIEEGSGFFEARSFRARENRTVAPVNNRSISTPVAKADSWLLEPFSLLKLLMLDASRFRPLDLTGLKGTPLAIRFRTTDCADCSSEIPVRQGKQGRILTVQLLENSDIHADFGAQEPVPLISHERFQMVASVIKHLFVRRQTPTLPLTLLLDREGALVKIYRNNPPPDSLFSDMEKIPSTWEDRLQLALPFDGRYYGVVGGRLEVYFLIASRLLEQGYSEAALELYRRAAIIDPKISEIHNNMGAAYARLGRLEESLHHFREASRLHPENSEILFNLGTTLAMIGELQEAVSILQQATAIDRLAPRIWHNLGNAYLSLGRFSEAQTALEFGLELDPKQAEVHNSLGTLHAEQGQWRKAIQFFREATRLQPDLLSAYLNLGILYWRQGQHQEAVQMFRKVLEIDPDHPDATRWIGELTETQ